MRSTDYTIVSGLESTLSRVSYSAYFSARNRGATSAAADMQADRVCAAYVANEIKRHGADHVYLAHGVTTQA